MKRIILATALFLAAPMAQAERAPEVTLTDAAGTQVTLPRAQDGVDIYLFWASWCPMCKAAMPTIQQIDQDYDDQVTVLALQIKDEEVPDASGFLEERGFDFTVFPAADAAMVPYDVEGTPTIYLVDNTGELKVNVMETLFSRLPEEFPDWDRDRKIGWFTEQADQLIRDSVDQLLLGS